MPISDDSKAALALLKDLQANVRNTEDLRSNPQVNDDLNTLISVLESPVFQSILNIQDSLRELKKQVSKTDLSLGALTDCCLPPRFTSIPRYCPRTLTSRPAESWC